MKLINLSTVGVVLADSGMRSELTSIYGLKAMKERENQSRKMGDGEIGSSMQARKGNALCSLRSNIPQLQCCDGVEITCYGCNGVLLDQGQQCDYQPVKTPHLVNYRDCFCDASCMIFGDCCEDHVVTCRHLYPGYEATTTTTSTTTTTTTTTTTSTSTTTTPATTSANKQLFTLLDSLKLVFE